MRTRRPEREQDGGDDLGQRPDRHEIVRHPVRQVGDRVEIEVVAPDQRHCRAGPADRDALLRHRADIEIVDQHQHAGGHQQPQHDRDVEDHLLHPLDRAEPQFQHDRDRLQRLDEGEHDHQRAHWPPMAIAPVAGEQGIDKAQPAKIPQGFRQLRR